MSITALPDTKMEHRFSIEECDENKAMLREKGGTVVDAADSTSKRHLTTTIY